MSEGINRAGEMLAQGNHAAARDILREVLEFAPVEAKAWHMLGRALQRLNEHDEALRCFQTAASCYAGHGATTQGPASLRLARMLWQQGEHTDAREMLRTLIAERPEDATLQQLRDEWEQEG